MNQVPPTILVAMLLVLTAPASPAKEAANPLDPSAQVSQPPMAEYGILVDGLEHAARPRIEVLPGGAGRYQFVVKNVGFREDEVELEISSSGEWPLEADIPPRLRLLPGEEERFKVEVRVPAGARIGETDEVSLAGRSLTSPALTGRHTVTFLVPSTIAIECTRDSVLLAAGKSETVVCQAHNIGTSQQAFRLQASSVGSCAEKPWADLDALPAELTLPPGRTANLFVKITVPAGSRMGEECTMDLKYQSPDDPLAAAGARIRVKVKEIRWADRVDVRPAEPASAGRF